MQEIRIFEKEEFGKVRTIIVNGEPYFVGKDVAEILGYSNSRKAISDHVDKEDKGVTKCDTPGGTQVLTVINESGLYSLILSSTLPNAKQFKHWVTSEILPSIRKTGGYVSNDELFVDTYLPYADEQTRAMFLSTLQTVRTQNETIKKQKEEIEHKEDVIIGLVDDISLAEKRQVLNRVVRYNHANYQERWKLLYREFENKYHIDLQHRFEKYNEENKPKCKNKLEYIDRVMGKLPELYEIATKLFENDIKELVEEMYEIAG